MSQKRLKARVLFPIGAKLVIIITILLLASLGSVIFMVSVLSTQDVQRTAEETNFIINIRAGAQVENSFNGIRDSVLFYLEMLERLPPSQRDPDMEKYFYNRNQNLAAIGVMAPKSGTEPGVLSHYFFNSKFLEANGIEPDTIVATYYSMEFNPVPDLIQFYNVSPHFQISMLVAVFIRSSESGNETVLILFTPDELLETFASGTNTSFLISSSGSLLFHPDIELVLGGANFSFLPIVETMQQEGDSNRQVSYSDDGAEYFGAYYRIAGTDAVMITTIPHHIVFEAVNGITRQNIFLTAVVLFLAITFIWFFSKTISNPARTLAAAAVKIEEGDFTVALKPRTKDELGLLTESFNKMCSALNNFGRFTNKDIAIRAMRGEIKPGGFPKHATIFFSDIRQFTKKSETFTRAFGDDAPNRIVLWLNDYFSHMIPCVEGTGGVVDKFIGDGMMAHWGTVSTAGSPAQDAYNCVKAALMMRKTLIELNAARPKDDANSMISIGCGINSGMVIAGQLGSEERMEYTVIGDPVNLTSRVEALNKPFGTDILITENTWKLAGDKFITEEMLPVNVKGKEEPVRVFAVINFIGGEGPQTLQQVRELLGIKEKDFSSADVGGEEKKYQIRGQDRRLNHPPQETAASPVSANAIGAGPVVTMTSFGSSVQVKGAGQRVPVFFAWNISGGRGGAKRPESDVHVVVEVAADAGFENILEEREIIGSLSVTIPLEPGSYWWRAYPVHSGSREPANSFYPSGTLTVDAHAKERIKINHR